DQLTEAGARVIGPCSTAGRAIVALDEHNIDVAIIDYVLSDDNSGALQDAPATRGIPFVVVTGYPRVLVRRDERQSGVTTPVSAEALTSAVASLSRAGP